MISALILEKIMWKSNLKFGLLCKNKIVTIFLLFFYISKRYLLKKNTPRVYIWENGKIPEKLREKILATKID
jgi:hypothetical protein